ncbi:MULTISPECIES: hypothetical protein [unclassified Bradyrhizobium]|uniref:hypothetical protein n=1 Tax=unclassified Bradyrhizobium TaxID=2631580 RepID=UPI00289839A5|nr:MULTISPECIES: hypothetical protein [unclassified Bradyrhizobium]
MVAAVTARLSSHPPAGLAGEGLECLGCDAWPSPIKRALGPLCVSTGLIPDALQLGHALLEQRIGDVSDPVFDRVVQPLELGFRLGRTLSQFGNMRRSALGASFPAIKDSR